MKTSCLRLKLVELTSLQVSMLTIRVILTYLTYLNVQTSRQDEPFQYQTPFVVVDNVSSFCSHKVHHKKFRGQISFEFDLADQCSQIGIYSKKPPIFYNGKIIDTY